MCTDGTPDTEATVVECKSFTGSIALLGGGAIEAIFQRQHLKNPDSHIAEVTAGGTCLNQAYTHRGVLGELRLPAAAGGVGAGLQRLAFYNLHCSRRWICEEISVDIPSLCGCV